MHCTCQHYQQSKYHLTCKNCHNHDYSHYDWADLGTGLPPSMKNTVLELLQKAQVTRTSLSVHDIENHLYYEYGPGHPMFEGATTMKTTRSKITHLRANDRDKCMKEGERKAEDKVETIKSLVDLLSRSNALVIPRGFDPTSVTKGGDIQQMAKNLNINNTVSNAKPHQTFVTIDNSKTLGDDGSWVSSFFNEKTDGKKGPTAQEIIHSTVIFTSIALLSNICSAKEFLDFCVCLCLDGTFGCEKSSGYILITLGFNCFYFKRDRSTYTN
jgi:hypothetical protein